MHSTRVLRARLSALLCPPPRPATAIGGKPGLPGAAATQSGRTAHPPPARCPGLPQTCPLRGDNPIRRSLSHRDIASGLRTLATVAGRSRQFQYGEACSEGSCGGAFRPSRSRVRFRPVARSPEVRDSCVRRSMTGDSGPGTRHGREVVICGLEMIGRSGFRATRIPWQRPNPSLSPFTRRGGARPDVYFRECRPRGVGGIASAGVRPPVRWLSAVSRATVRPSMRSVGRRAGVRYGHLVPIPACRCPPRALSVRGPDRRAPLPFGAGGGPGRRPARPLRSLPPSFPSLSAEPSPCLTLFHPPLDQVGKVVRTPDPWGTTPSLIESAGGLPARPDDRHQGRSASGDSGSAGLSDSLIGLPVPRVPSSIGRPPDRPGHRSPGL
jgi:hypothetical protein